MQAIVTSISETSRRRPLEPFNIEAQEPVQLVLDVANLAPARVAAVIQQQ